MLPLQNYIKRGPYDELWTPLEAFTYLTPYLPGSGIVWECAPGTGVLVDHLQKFGLNVVDWDGNFLKDTPPDAWDFIVTNPPYSKKHLFLKRAHELKKPYAILLPVTTLGVKRCQIWMGDVDVLFLPKRVDFTGGGAPWFAVAWFTKGLGLDRQLTFMGVE